MLYPPKGRAKRTQWGPLDSLSILYVIEKPKLNFQKHERASAFFVTKKTFIVRYNVTNCGTYYVTFSFTYRVTCSVTYCLTCCIT